MATKQPRIDTQLTRVVEVEAYGGGDASLVLSDEFILQTIACTWSSGNDATRGLVLSLSPNFNAPGLISLSTISISPTIDMLPLSVIVVPLLTIRIPAGSTIYGLNPGGAGWFNFQLYGR